MNILLLIAAIATLAAWLAGLFIKNIGKASDFQAHSAKVSSALSIIFLGRRALKKRLIMNLEQYHHSCILLHQAALQVHREKPH